MLILNSGSLMNEFSYLVLTLYNKIKQTLFKYDQKLIDKLNYLLH